MAARISNVIDVIVAMLIFALGVGGGFWLHTALCERRHGLYYEEEEEEEGE